MKSDQIASRVLPNNALFKPHKTILLKLKYRVAEQSDADLRHWFRFEHSSK